MGPTRSPSQVSVSPSEVCTASPPLPAGSVRLFKSMAATGKPAVPTPPASCFPLSLHHVGDDLCDLGQSMKSDSFAGPHPLHNAADRPRLVLGDTNDERR